jgi:hypothetical protein
MNKGDEGMVHEQLFSIRKVFSDFFLGKGFLKLEAEPLIPCNDPSLFYTNSSIVRFKPFFQKGSLDISSPLLVCQPCLRFRGLNSFLDEDAKPYLSFFNMVGTLYPPHELEWKASLTIELLTQKYGIAKENILLRVCPSDKRLIDAFSGIVTMEVGGQKEEYYQWKFGMEGISGRGATFLIKQPNGLWGELGQIVEIQSFNQPIGYEFGFGAETLCRRLNGFQNFYQAWSIYDVVGIRHGDDSWKVMEAVSGLTAVYTTSQEPDRSKRGRILRKMLVNAIAIQDMLCIPTEQMESYIDEYNVLEFSGKADTKRLKTDWVKIRKSLEDNILKLDGYCKEQHLRMVKRGQTEEISIRKCFEKSEGEYYVPPRKKGSVINRYFASDHIARILPQISR